MTKMLHEWAEVIAWEEGIAKLQYARKSSCGSCKMQSSCGIALMNRVGHSPFVEITVPIENPLVIGQRVELSISERSLLSAAAILYLVPLLGFFIGVGLLTWLSENEIFALLGGLFGGIIGFWVTRYMISRLERQGSCQFTIRQIALPNGEVSILS